MSYGLREESTVIGNINFLDLTRSWIEQGNDLPTQTPFKSDKYYMQLNMVSAGNLKRMKYEATRLYAGT